MKALTVSNELELVKREGDKYFARYLVTEMVSKTVTHSVFTGNVSVTNVMTKSRTLKATDTAYHFNSEDVQVELSEDEAKALVSKFEYRRQNTASGWILWVIA